MPKVHCSVANCAYWNDGNLCAANDIDVLAQNSSPQDTSTYSNAIESGALKDYAKSSPDTCCETFCPR